MYFNGTKNVVTILIGLLCFQKLILVPTGLFDDGVHMYVTVKVTYNRPTETESGIKE